MTEPTVRATRYEVSLLPATDINAGVFALAVEYRAQLDGADLWCVSRYGRCLGADGEWDYEPIPSSRTKEWIASHRFDLDTAIRLAKEAAPHVMVNGHTVADAIARNQEAGQ